MSPVARLGRGDIGVMTLENGKFIFTLANGWQFRTPDKAIYKSKEAFPNHEVRFIALVTGEVIEPGMIKVERSRSDSVTAEKPEDKTILPPDPITGYIR